MRILQLHSDFIEYQPIEKEIKMAEEAEKKKTRLEDLVVLFTAIEEGDDEEVIKKAIDEIKSSLDVIKAKKILIYPYAHLSKNLAKPANALKLIKEMESYAKESGIETYRTPFGWCKQFHIQIKGHPLAEQSKVFLASKPVEKREEVSEALKKEEKIKSRWFIMKTNGELIPIDIEENKIVGNFDFKKHENLKKFAMHEMTKSRVLHQTPPHIKLMRELEIADFEPGSDPGNLRFYPKGRLIKSLLEQFVTQKVIEYGGMDVETPIMYDFEHPSLHDYLNRFPARQYIVKSEDKEFFLRFSACFGQFLMLSNATISYKQLPLRIYELTRYSFRREKSGELVGLRRLRAFTMPDVHAICENLDQAMEEFKVRFDLCRDTLNEIGLNIDDYELVIRFTKDFYEKNKDFIRSLVKLHGKPALVEMWDERIFYFILKYELNFIDALSKASALSTDQIDIENAKRYGITFIDENSKKQYPVILHCSLSGAIERVIYALLEKAYMDEKKGKVPRLPTWLSPTQVRIIPVSEKYIKISEKIANKIEKENIRVDIDDRNITVEKKIRAAELEWVPNICVVGPKEIKNKILTVRFRETKKIEEMKIEEFVKMVEKEIVDKPFRKLNLSKFLTKRPKFVAST
ncbi:MAG: threonine--tRNA ligase [Candidatus Aenigmarchaeota archaeon]|nr:threonine--tRNA ligase [Candidatus Aenigmarchaeota archaeon]